MRMAPALIPQESMEWLKGLKPGVKTVFVNHYPQDTSVLNYFDVTRELKRIGTRFELGGHWHSNVSLNYDGIPGALNRSTLTAGKQPGYNVVMIQNDSVTISERRLYGSTTVQLEPWYTRRLAEVRDTVTYDADKHAFGVVSEGYITDSGDSHVAIVNADDFAIQIEYAPYYHGEDFTALEKSVEENYKNFGRVSFKNASGICFTNGGSYCMAFPAADSTADYVLATVVLMGDDNEDERVKLRSNPEMLAIMDTLVIE